MTEPSLTIALDSAMVTWEDLGLSGLSDSKKEKIYYERFSDWLDNCKGDYRASLRGIWFARGNEAAMFKLTFAGAIAR
jgi:hypothetical protein